MADAKSSLSFPIMAGLAGRCPRCGKGKLFDGFLQLGSRCEACGLDYAFADPGDGPAVFAMFIGGFIVVAAALIVEFAYQPPFWLHAVLWAPLILLTSGTTVTWAHHALLERAGRVCWALPLRRLPRSRC